MKKLISADTVDANGKVWDTVGENIRKGKKDFSVNDVKAIVDILFPVGAIYCGENAFLLSVGKWNQITDNSGRIISLGNALITGSSYNGHFYGTGVDITVSLRMWKRVS